MLKRQRTPSLTPYSSSVPLVSDLSPVEKAHDAKRRRVLPPVLDGRFRGWGNTHKSMHEDAEDEYGDDVEESLDHDDQSRDDGHGVTSAYSPYKSANSFLHELHTLHRHRLLFSSSQPPQSPSIDRRTFTPPSNLLGHQPDYHTHDHTCSDSLQCKEMMPTIPVQLRRQQKIELRSCHPEVNADPPEEQVPAEVQLVKEHYEDTNRLLGSLFLSRRRELGFGSSNTGLAR